MRLMRACGTVLRKILPVQHPGQPQMMDIFGAAGDLLARFEARDRLGRYCARLSVSPSDQTPATTCMARAEMNAEQRLLVGSRAAAIRRHVNLVDCGVAGAAQYGVVQRCTAQNRFSRRKTGGFVEGRAQHKAQIFHAGAIELG